MTDDELSQLTDMVRTARQTGRYAMGEWYDAVDTLVAEVRDLQAEVPALRKILAEAVKTIDEADAELDVAQQQLAKACELLRLHACDIISDGVTARLVGKDADVAAFLATVTK